MRITVIVATLGRPELAPCLASLEEQTRPADEILVVNNGSGAIETPSARRLPARLIRCVQPGISAARNAGARVAEGELLAFLDDDAVAETGWLAALEAGFQASPVAGIAGAILRNRQDRGTREAALVDRSTPDWFWKTNFGGVGNGGNLAFRRDAFLAVGGFDEHLGLGAAIPTSEEHNLFFRLVTAGESVAYEPRAIVYHAAPAHHRRSDLQVQRAAAAYVCYLWEHFPESRPQLRALLRKGRTPVPRHEPERGSKNWARWFFRGLGLADYLAMRK